MIGTFQHRKRDRGRPVEPKRQMPPWSSPAGSHGPAGLRMDAATGPLLPTNLQECGVWPPGTDKRTKRSGHNAPVRLSAVGTLRSFGVMDGRFDKAQTDMLDSGSSGASEDQVRWLIKTSLSNRER